MDYLAISQFAATWGLVLLCGGFAAALIYALWPGNKDKFSRAAQAPLDDGDDDGR
ncbi:MAG: cbb3-type cytochrome c oxidase subunit 3 [Terricaulis sp.]|nr:cbb3-type cytochrome c oxidase subunit 3 [Terricaulis sp.]